MPIALAPEARFTRPLPDDIRIPARPFRARFIARRPEPWWREAMRWSLIGLTASWVAGEIALTLAGF